MTWRRIALALAGMALAALALAAALVIAVRSERISLPDGVRSAAEPVERPMAGGDWTPGVRHDRRGQPPWM